MPLADLLELHPRQFTSDSGDDLNARMSTWLDGCKQCVHATGAFQSECGPISPPARRKTQPDTSRFGFFPVVGALASSDVGYTAQWQLDDATGV